MYKFAIIDDNHFDQKLILSTLEKECQLHNIEYKLDVYNNSLNFDLSIFYDAILKKMVFHLPNVLIIIMKQKL